jgi:outer membrane protein TolC
MRRILIFTALALVATTAPMAATASQAPEPEPGPPVTIAVVRDGPAPARDTAALVEGELQELMAGRTIRFLSSPEFDAGWRADRTDAALQAALDDPEVDMILTVGALVTASAAAADLSKPVVSAFIQRRDLFGLYDAEEDRSVKENLAWILITGRDRADIERFRGLVPFETALLLVPRSYFEAGGPMASALADAARDFGIRTVPVGEDASIPSSELEGAEAALLPQLPHLSKAARKGLIGTLTDRGIPTFSLVGGHPDIELGALATTGGDVSSQLSRRAALNLSELIRGRPTSHLPVSLEVNTRLVVNARTAAAIGYAPDARTRVLARFLHAETLASEEEPLTLDQTLQMALTGNIGLAISEQDVETAYQRQRVAQSAMLPQAYAPATYYQFNPRGLDGFIPDKTFSLGVYLRQMIYDDRVVTDYKSAGKDHEASQEALEAERMNVLASAGAAFLDLTLSRILFGIEVQDLALAEENLQLARVRLETGYSGPDEVLRWEAEVARRRSTLLDREAAVDTQRIALNQVLGIEQDRLWAPQDIPVDPETFSFVGGRLGRAFDDTRSVERLQEFSVQFALENAPEMRFFRRQMESRGLQLEQRQRRWWLPSFWADFSYDYDIARSPELPELDKGVYQLQLQGVYPLFEGGARSREIKRVDSEVRRLGHELEQARQLVERRTRTSFERMRASFPIIMLNRMAAESASKNLAIVRDQYADGLVNVTDLVSAQVEAFNAESAAAGANYVFLLDLLAYQRALSWFEATKTPDERTEFVRQATVAVTAPATPPAPSPTPGGTR